VLQTATTLGSRHAPDVSRNESGRSSKSIGALVRLGVVGPLVALVLDAGEGVELPSDAEGDVGTFMSIVDDGFGEVPVPGTAVEGVAAAGAGDAVADPPPLLPNGAPPQLGH
jgi:hypothetical protein